MKFGKRASASARTVPPTVTCEDLQPELSAYIDGELDADAGSRVIRHLETCAECRTQVRAYESLGRELRALPVPPPAPPELTLRLRVLASHFSVRGQQWEYWKLRLRTTAQAMVVPMTVGTAVALFLFSTLAGSVRLQVVNDPSHDVEIGDAAPPRLTFTPADGVDGSVVVEADIDSTGHVYSYSVLSGPTDPAMISRLNNQLLLSIFQPATTFFGQPTSGSLVVSFGTVDVRG